MTNQNWKFDLPPDEAVITSKYVVSRGKPLLLVCHYPGDDGWAFLTGESFSMEESLLVSLESILEIDQSIEAIADLPPGWSAQRKSVNEPWVRYEDND